MCTAVMRKKAAVKLECHSVLLSGVCSTRCGISYTYPKAMVLVPAHSRLALDFCSVVTESGNDTYSTALETSFFWIKMPIAGGILVPKQNSRQDGGVCKENLSKILVMFLNRIDT